MRDVLDVIKSRRSVRSYRQEQISQEELDKIIEAGIYAPSAHNEQPWHFTIIQNQEILQNINKITRESMAKSDIEWIKKLGSKPDYKVNYDAPTLIIVSGRQDGMAWNVDCSAAIQNMLLEAENLGIGSVWLGFLRFFFSNKEEVSKLGIPSGYEPFYGVAFGYKKEEKPLPAPRRATNVVTYIK